MWSCPRFHPTCSQSPPPPFQILFLKSWEWTWWHAFPSRVPQAPCLPLTHVKYEKAERANSNWPDLLPVPCYMIPLMLVLRKTKLRNEKKGKAKQFYRWVSHPTSLAAYLLCIKSWYRLKQQQQQHSANKWKTLLSIAHSFWFLRKFTSQSLINSFSTSSRNYLNNWSICSFAFINTLT